MKKVLSGVIVVAIGITALTIFSFKDEAHKTSSIPPEEIINTLDDRQSFESNNPIKSVSGKTGSEISNILVDMNSDQKKSTEPVKTHQNKETVSSISTSPWRINNSHINERYQLPPQVHEKMPVNISTDNINALEVGSQMEIMLPDFSKHTAVISDITYNNSSKTMTGHLNNDPSTDVVITSGRRSVYATVATPLGAYSLQSTDGEGVLYKVPPRSEIEELETDALIPDHH